MVKIAIITSHPIQYNAPWFAILANEDNIELKVFYTYSQSETGFFDIQFGKIIEWDIPLLDNYNYEFVKNTANNPGLTFLGIINPDLIEKIKTFEPNVILVFGWNYYSHLKVIRYFSGKFPVWFRGDSTLLDKTFFFKKIFRRIFLKWVYSYVDKALSVGQENEKYFIAHGLKSEQIIFIPHAIDNLRFSDSIEKRYELKAKEWRKNLGYTDSDFVILFAGKFDKNKQPEFLVRAIQQYNNLAIQKVKLLMVGNGPLEFKLKQLASEDINIQFLSFINQSLMPIVYRLGNVYCLPSRSETWGLAINEAMACGRAILCSNKVGAAVDLVRNGQNGYTFHSGDLESLITVIKKIHNKHNIDRLGHESYKIIEDWSFSVIVETVKRVLLKTMN